MSDKLIRIAELRAMAGGVSAMSIHRWERDPASGFPQPQYFNRRRFWREADVVAWLSSRSNGQGRAA